MYDDVGDDHSYNDGEEVKERRIKSQDLYGCDQTRMLIILRKCKKVVQGGKVQATVRTPPECPMSRRADFSFISSFVMIVRRTESDMVNGYDNSVFWLA